ncbi:hypothetical protein D5086_030160 [Populus alba]|uniref:Uncharacterized protein n=1 Tax=Populus alba TaxID=43335 RepID=A0ACC4AMP5_POPAL
MVPHGFRFNPTDEELVQFLDRKASGQEMPLHFILETNVYEREPQDLECSRTMKEIAIMPSRLTGLCMNTALNQEPRRKFDHFVDGQQQQETDLITANNYEGYDHESYYQWNNMQQSPPYPYDPYLPAPPSTSSGHYYVEQQEKLESSDEHPFPSLWSWTN